MTDQEFKELQQEAFLESTRWLAQTIIIPLILLLILWRVW